MDENKKILPTKTRAVQRSESKRLLDYNDPLFHVKSVLDVSKEALAERKEHAKRRVL
jgi:hypothetical protein